MPKRLFKGTFNWAGESYELYTHARSSDVAWMNFTTQLAKKIGRLASVMRMEFSGLKDNYYIEEVKDDDDREGIIQS